MTRSIRVLLLVFLLIGAVTVSAAGQTGWTYINGHWVYYTSKGKVTGWLYTGSNWYYFNSSGAMQTGMQTIKGKAYYFYSSGAMAAQKDLQYNTESIPVLTFHSFGSTNGNELVISPKSFDNEMQWLKNNGYTTLTLDDAYNFILKNKPIPKKSLVLTFDDGYKDNFTYMYPILKKYGFKAAIFVITDKVDKKANYLTSSQLKELDANGISIESHTVYHDRLETLSYQQQLSTLKDSKLFLENLLHKNVNYIAYPYGAFNSVTPQATKDAGYKMAFTMDRGWSNKNNGIYKLQRVYISAFYDLNIFINRMTNPNY